ncbi:hypothetical protein EZ313_19375 [Ramlibacter henchirensis]|uniref:Bulb-type lectin domain-containing protein n=1 Tax=Ramlibacter henchirensis TaxID=204072 RepID=A0A4Z0BMT2_9BURK|nr:hypothetical protein [Ramlibacter henchirensis]TFZ00616.1 hypothetical protein EZ313_19375 [Ramlibacter henchirensis]
MVGLSDSFTTDQFGNPRPAISLVKFSSNGSVVWQKVWTGETQRGGGRAPTVALTSDQSSVYVTGLSNANGGDAVLLKFDSDGNLLWQRTWGGSVIREESEAVATDAQGAAYISGTQRDHQAGTAGLFVVKFNGDGTVAWQKIWNDASGSAVAVGPDGHVYAAGSKMRTDGSFEFDVLALKITNGGGLVWDMTYSAAGTVDARGGMTVGPDGGPIFAGAIQAGKKVVGISALLVKLTTDGGLSFDSQWGGSKNGTSGHAVALAPDGSIHVAGAASLGSGADEAFVFHVDTQGRGLDAVTWGGAGFDSGHGVGVAGDGTVVLAATTNPPGPPFTLLDTSGKVSSVGGAVAVAGGSLADAPGLAADAGALVINSTGGTSYAGNSETALVKFFGASKK